ncbi:MAG: TadE family protein [Dehalococcoidia bacterium]|nr:TadE family protein [Dehalococcoidia bacterium]
MLGLRFRGRHSESQRGQSAVEFALVIPIALMVSMGIFDFARMYFTVITISNAAREGARAGSIRQCEDPAGVVANSIQYKITQAATGVTIDPADITVAYLENDGITPLVSPQMGKRIKVDVSVDYIPLTPVVGQILLTFIGNTLTRTAETFIEQTNQTCV